MAMLYCLYKEGVKTTAVHINYGLRGTDSDKDQALVEEIATLWDIDAISLNLSELTQEPGNFQNRAREERYRIFEELMQELDATTIATAHHLNDQIETIFQKILRGSGITAWKGMDAFEGIFFRPLIDVPRENILTFVSELNIPYRIDRTNEESTYARNFIRNNWFPQLDDLFPGWQDNVLSLQNRAREYELLLKEKAEQIAVDDNSFDRSLFLAADPILQPAIVKYLYEETFPDHTLSKGVLLKMDDLSELQTGTGITLGAGRILMRDRHLFSFMDQLKDQSEDVDNDSFEDSKILEVSDLKDQPIINIDYLQLSISNYLPQAGKERLQADLSAIRFPITIRKWRDGDRFQPFGMEGTQLVSDHLTNKRVSSGKKRDSKVIEMADGDILAVLFPDAKNTDQPGTLSELARCSGSTEKALTIEINKE